MKPVHWLLLITGLFALVLWRVLQNPDPAPQSAGLKTLSKPARAKPARKPARALAKKTTRAYEPVKNLPPGVIKLTQRDYDLDRLAGTDIGPDDI